MNPKREVVLNDAKLVGSIFGWANPEQALKMTREWDMVSI
jgi:hypothetical protein